MNLLNAYSNVSNGTGYCYSYDIVSGDVEEEWSTGGPSYALQGFSSTNGYLLYGDDLRAIHIIRPACS